MRAVITGVRGFIGSHLYMELVKDGWDVKGIDNLLHPTTRRIPSIYGDVRYYYDVDKLVEWADVVFHLAAQISVDKSINNPEETIDINVNGTLNVLKAVTKYDKSMVFASSSEVYGSSQCDLMGEDHPLDAQSPYAASKVAGDRLCKAYHETYGTKAVILRNFNTFGEYQADDSYGGVIAIFTNKALKDEPLTIFGTGKQERDYMHVSTAVEAYKFCGKNGYLGGHAVNVGSGETVKIKELAELIIKITGSKSSIVHGKPRAGEVQRLCANTQKVRDFGFTFTTDFEKDLTKYVKWYKKRFKG